MAGPAGGQRVKEVGRPHIYLTLDEKYHHIPDETVYNRLFGRGPAGDTAVREESDIDDRLIAAISLGTDVDVIKGDIMPHVYFFNHGVRRHIVHQSFLDRAFGGRYREIPQAVLDALPTVGPINEA